MNSLISSLCSILYHNFKSSIVSNLQLRGLLKDSYCFIELGAGRAMLALAISAALPSAPLILVEVL